MKEIQKKNMFRWNASSTEEGLRALTLWTTTRNNISGQDALKHAPAVIKEIHQYLMTILDIKEEVGGTKLQLMLDINTILDQFQADVSATRAKLEKSDEVFAGIGVGLMPAFLNICYPRVLKN